MRLCGINSRQIVNKDEIIASNNEELGMGMLNKVQNWLEERKVQKELRRWEAKGHPCPPPHRIKQEALCKYRDQFGTRILVETGTFRGDMMHAMAGQFDQLYSIELSEQLFQKAKERFQDRPHVTILQGDSGRVLGDLIPKLSSTTLFWLDGHYSAGETAKGEKDTPIYEELAHILDDQRFQHIVLVDDARLFGTDPSYPKYEEIESFVKNRRPQYSLRIETDSIRILPHDQA